MKNLKQKFQLIFFDQKINYSHTRIVMAFVAIAVFHFAIPTSKSREGSDVVAMWINVGLSLVVVVAAIWFAISKDFEKVKRVLFLSLINYIRMYLLLILSNILFFPIEALLFRFVEGYDLKAVSLLSEIVFFITQIYFCILIYLELMLLKGNKHKQPILSNTN